MIHLKMQLAVGLAFVVSTALASARRVQADPITLSGYIQEVSSSHTLPSAGLATRDTGDALLSILSPATMEFQDGGVYTMEEYVSTDGSALFDGAGLWTSTLDNALTLLNRTLDFSNAQSFAFSGDTAFAAFFNHAPVLADADPTAALFAIVGHITTTIPGAPMEIVFQEWSGQSAGAGDHDADDSDPGPADAPEPGTLALLGTGLIGLGAAVRRSLVKIPGDSE